jgi:hypothetical protein
MNYNRLVALAVLLAVTPAFAQTPCLPFGPCSSSGSSGGSGICLTRIYTVATLPGSGCILAQVSDAIECTPNATLVGGGTVTCLVTWNQTVWIGG